MLKLNDKVQETDSIRILTHIWEVSKSDAQLADHLAQIRHDEYTSILNDIDRELAKAGDSIVDTVHALGLQYAKDIIVYHHNIGINI